MPKKVKYRRQHRGKRRGKAMSGNTLNFGDYGLQALESCWLTANQIEAARIAMTRHIRRGGKVWIRVFPDKPYTKKPAETRMGSGKGAPEGWVAVVKPGRILFEMAGPAEEVAREAMRLASHKLPIDVRFVVREKQEAVEEEEETIPAGPSTVAESSESEPEAENVESEVGDAGGEEENAAGSAQEPV